MSEKDRLRFIVQRDGLEEAISFAKRTNENYRKCMMQDGRRLENGEGRNQVHFASLREFKDGFEESCVEFERFLASGGQL